MDSNQRKKSSFMAILYPITGILFKEWQTVFDVSQRIYSRLMKEQLPGVYEILNYETTLELNTTGSTAKFQKIQEVKFLQDNIISFQDFVWGEGDIFAAYECSPGVVVDKYQVGDRWNVLISLRETKSKGDIEKFHISSIFKNGYTKKDEWQQVEVRHRTHKLRMTIIFPKKRHCTKATVHARSKNQTTVLSNEHFSVLPDGRQSLTWSARKIPDFEIYTIRWTW